MTQEYQEIQDKARQIMMKCKMVQAYVAKGDKQKIDESMVDLKHTADNLVESYPGEVARFIPYLEAMSTIMKALRELNRPYSVTCMAMESLRTLLPFTLNLDHEQAATILTRQLFEAFDSVDEFCMVNQEMRESIYERSIPQALASLLHESMQNLAEINPNNVYLNSLRRTNILDYLKRNNLLGQSNCSLQTLSVDVDYIYSLWNNVTGVQTPKADETKVVNIERLFFNIKSAINYVMLENEDVFISALEQNKKVYHAARLYASTLDNYLHQNPQPKTHNSKPTTQNPYICAIDDCAPYCLPQHLQKMKDSIKESFLMLDGTFRNIGVNLDEIINDDDKMLDAAEACDNEQLAELIINYIMIMFEIEGQEILNDKINIWAEGRDYQALADYLNSIAQELCSEGVLRMSIPPYTPEDVAEMIERN